MPKRKAASKKGVSIPAGSLKPGRKIRLFAPTSVPQITRGEKHAEEHYITDAEGAIMVPSTEVNDFLAMGCSRTPQQPVAVSNVASAE